MTIQKTIKFLSKLNQNNSKIWMDKNKEEYLKQRSWFVELTETIIDRLAFIDEDVAFLSSKQCIFRINRDVRFSHNKTPYKTHFSSAIQKGGKKTHFAGYYFQINHKGELFMGGGNYEFDSARLLRVRQEIERNSKPLKRILNSKKFKTNFTLWENKLKTNPRGFAKDHPEIKLLRYKSIAAATTININNLSQREVEEIIIEKFTLLKPLITWLNNIE